MSRVELVDVDLASFEPRAEVNAEWHVTRVLNDEELKQRLEDIRDGYKNEDPRIAAVIVGQGAMHLLGIAGAQNAIGFELSNTIVHPDTDISNPEIHRLGIEAPGRYAPQRPLIFKSTRNSTRYERTAAMILPQDEWDAGERYKNTYVVAAQDEGDRYCRANDTEGDGQQMYLKCLGHFAGSILEVMDAPKN